MSPRSPLVLWTFGRWQCDYYPAPHNAGRLQVYCGELLVTTESSPPGHAAEQRAEVLRQRVLRGDLKVPTHQ